MSTYSTNLALELIGNGEQAGNWGQTTNTNLGTLLEQAISGYVTQTMSNVGDTTLAMTAGASATARNMFIELTGSLSASRNLVVPANKKLYFIYNNTTGGFAVTVKVAGLTGVSVPNGTKTILVCNGTDIVNATSFLVSSGGILPVASGGTGTATPSLVQGSNITISGTWPNQTINATGSAGGVTSFSAGSTGFTPSAATSGAVTLGGTLAIANGGTGTTSTTFVNLATNVTGTLPVARGGTGASSLAGAGIITTGGGQTVSGNFDATGTITAGTLSSTNVTTTGNSACLTHLFAGTNVDNPVANGRVTVNWDPAGEQGITLKATGTTFIGNPMAFLDSSNTVVAYLVQTTGGVSFTNISDYRLKNSITPMTGALAKVVLLKPCTYKWNKDNSDGQGFIAHELQAVIKECVSGEKDALNEDGSIKPQGIDTNKLIPILTAAMQELKALVDVQAARITALEAKVG